MNPIKLRNLLTNILGGLQQVLGDQDALLAYVAGTPLEAKAEALLPEAKRAALVGVIEDYTNAVNVVTERIDSVDVDW